MLPNIDKNGRKLSYVLKSNFLTYVNNNKWDLNVQVFLWPVVAVLDDHDKFVRNF